MREISPAVGMSVEQFLAVLPPQLRQVVETVRAQKQAGIRIRPSATVIDRSAILTKDFRAKLLDAVAMLVDENYCGRSEMCIQYADLLDRALKHLQFPSRAVIGTATYYSLDGDILHEWKHAWVRIGDEVVDGNIDSIPENPLVPCSVCVAPYWGPIRETPSDRKLREKTGLQMPADQDVIQIWWPDLKEWIDQNRG